MKQVIFLCLILVALLCGCFSYFNPPNEQNKCWYCTDLDMYLDYRQITTYDPDARNRKPGRTTLITDGEQITVDVTFYGNLFWFTSTESHSYREDPTLVSGTWYYEKDCIVMIIEEDELFHNRFSSFTFTPADVGIEPM